MDKAQKNFHRSRRKEFSRLIGKDSIAIIFSSSHQNKSYDGDFHFKQYKNFYYLTGFIEPDSALLLAPGGIKLKSDKKEKKVYDALYVQRKDPLMETWNGKRLGFKNVKQGLGIENGFENFKIRDVLNPKILHKFSKLYINFAEMIKLNGDMTGILNDFINSLNKIAPHTEIIDASYMLGKMRSVKSTYEIDLMKKASEISIRSYKETLKLVKPGKNENDIMASLEYQYSINGGQDIAYYPIVASGENACILHYESNDKKLKDGELLLIDSASEYNYYCSDITRTFPVNGKFTDEQKLIYEIVLKANNECIKKIKPGVKFSEIGKLSDDVLADGLFKAGLLKDKKNIKKYSMHGVGHHIGLDTHDAVPHSKTLNSDNDTLKPGNVLTIEPGLYFTSEMKEIPVKYRGIGVRIEDNVLVTRSGNENLTANMIKEVREIESLMKIR